MADKGDNAYKMTNPKRGPFIIINNETFAKNEKREGTEHDVVKLRATFGGTFGFEVVVHNNKKAEEIRGIIQKLGDGDYSDCDCLGIAILTHGEQYSDNIIYGCDGGEVDLDKVFEPLKTCKSLVGKPKLILVQAGPLSVDEVEGVGSGGFAKDGKQDESRKVPVEADFSYYFALDVQQVGETGDLQRKGLSSFKHSAKCFRHIPMEKRILNPSKPEQMEKF